eukprot:4155826-Lingulodinium_polyedra.AAC.1
MAARVAMSVGNMTSPLGMSRGCPLVNLRPTPPQHKSTPRAPPWGTRTYSSQRFPVPSRRGHPPRQQTNACGTPPPRPRTPPSHRLPPCPWRL